MTMLLHTVNSVSTTNQWFLIENEYTNFGFRISYFIWMLSGSNNLEQLNFYSKHLNHRSDDGKVLRGAYGPRMRSWVGADQLQESNKRNCGVTDVTMFQKPVGVDQLHKIYDDFKSNGLKNSCIGIYDPAIDFEESNDIPDLYSVACSVVKNSFNMNLIYGLIEYGSNFINDLWVFLKLAEMYRQWLELPSAYVKITQNGEEVACDETIHVKHSDFVVGTNPDDFLISLEALRRFEIHLRSNFKQSSFNNPSISLTMIIDMMKKNILEDIKLDIFKDFARSLLISGMCKSEDSVYEDAIMAEFDKIENLGLKQEIATALSTSKCLSVINQVKMAEIVAI